MYSPAPLSMTVTCFILTLLFIHASAFQVLAEVFRVSLSVLSSSPASPAPSSDVAMTNRDFWRETFPELSIGEMFQKEFPLHILSDPAIDLAGRKMTVEGYFQEADPELADLADRLATAIARCVSLNIPPVFIFLFDEAWAAFHRQHATIQALIGPNYQVLPDFWAWHVDPKAGQAGWRPHRDKGHIGLRADGAPKSLTIWIPLTEASPVNGCMYMLPANRDPVYGTEQDNQWQVDYPNIRALPGLPGDWFCWNQAVLHWGAQSSPFAERPRMSMALEFQRADEPAFNQPLLGTLPVLDFDSRLKLCAKQIIQYRHMYPLPLPIQALAEQILS